MSNILDIQLSYILVQISYEKKFKSREKTKIRGVEY